MNVTMFKDGAARLVGKGRATPLTAAMLWGRLGAISVRRIGLDTNLGESVWRIVTRLLALAATDEQLRSDIDKVAKGVLQVLAADKLNAVEPVSATGQADAKSIRPLMTQEPAIDLLERGIGLAEAPPVAAPEPAGPSVAELAKMLTFGGKPKPPVEAPVPDDEWDHDDPLPLQAHLVPIEKRCLVKADGARWAIRRRQMRAEGADFYMEIEPKDREIIQKAKDAETFLWMCHPAGPAFPETPARMEDVANCFDTLASGIGLVRELLNESNLNREGLEQALNLLAEASCTVRLAVAATGCEKDKDQQSVYEWLREATYRLHIFIPKYMAASDSADPSAWRDLADRIKALDDCIEERRSTGKKRKSILGTLRYHTERLRAGAKDDHDWQKTVEAVDQLVATGVPPSSIDIRDAILPIVDECPEMELPDNFQKVLNEIDRYLADQPDADKAATVKEPTKQVKEVAKLLQGQTIVLIGGYRRPASERAIERAFGLKEVDWVASAEHESVSSFEPNVADRDVAVVILMIRWSSHSYKELQKTCDKYGKPFLRLPGGYNPNQIAHQILEQCSGKLKKPRNK